MKGLWTTVTKVTNGRSYFVSTIKFSLSKRLYQTAGFPKIFDRLRISGDRKRLSLGVMRPIYTLARQSWCAILIRSIGEYLLGSTCPAPNRIRRASGPDNPAAGAGRWREFAAGD